jgi:hypothetical protein
MNGMDPNQQQMEDMEGMDPNQQQMEGDMEQV